MSDPLREIRSLVLSELAGELTGDALVERCTNVALALQNTPISEPGIPHEIWHYLHDADIRVRDRDYANVQLRRITEVLSRVP